MRYLKRFNESLNEYFTEITSEDAYDLLLTSEDMSNDLFNKIKQLIDSKGFKVEKHLSSYCQTRGIWIDDMRDGDNYYTIEVIKDEYFIFLYGYTDTYYKCDQFEGLIELLKYYNIIK